MFDISELHLSFDIDEVRKVCHSITGDAKKNQTDFELSQVKEEHDQKIYEFQILMSSIEGLFYNRFEYVTCPCFI